ncbi:DUF5683 domain-containing protein [Hymenobacter caeli]|uniref:DUF5683 domain-containing protein n=1 Tax=Hymenobacter caeli TaxID=2735894 RepID=A0ABX2FPR0_9BACT|nr:DUF5683 domain-containing protein [Hymenobacter caeli]NRT19148.1 hypothetical protein [Hymenobacter caeli]
MNKPLLRLAALLLLVLGALLGPRAARAQVYDPANPNANNPAVPKTIRPDTARVRKTTLADKRKKHAEDSVRRTEMLFGFRVTRPAKAGYLALVPGLGQVYNRKWWKLPIVYGGIGTVAYILSYEQRALNEYTNASNLISTDPTVAAMPLPNANLPGDRVSKERTVAGIQNGIIFYRHYRDGFILYTALAYGVTIIDAIVDAHLYSFDVSDDLSFRWQPTLLPVPGPVGGLALAPGVAVGLHFK